MNVVPMTVQRAWALSLVLAGVVAGCARNPVTGERELALVSESQEVQMGQQAAQEVEASLGLVDDAQLQAYVRSLGARLAAKSERPNLPWRFGVIEDPTPNAFALPGGPVYITRGLMSLMNSEAELASVLGHEIGHITARHSVRQISRAQLAQLGLGLALIFRPELQGLGNVLGGGLQLLFLKYGRDDERQADELGFKYALDQNYDVREMADVFKGLQRLGEKSGQSPLPSYLSTHPNPGERVENVQARIAALGRSLTGTTVGEAEYMNRIRGLVYGDNPRAGFFRGSLFMHPDLRFQVQFPDGWRTQNLSQAVVAVSPNQDGIVQLTLAKGDPRTAANQFFGQQGVQAGQVSQENINGNPAVVGYFQAQTEQGMLQGIAAFLSHGGHNYQVLGYAPSGRFGSYDALFRRTIGSFSTLTDSQALNVRPNRIEIVRLDSGMSLSEFNRRYPSAIPIEELAIINDVDNANTTLPAGRNLKRVVAG